ncbi:hypothetical protein IMZ48_20090 [Candidatus Bathyarchaeota archaeon]|nr:hypothetical protein [Candidatus Bathyarchaeota archaeon]
MLVLEFPNMLELELPNPPFLGPPPNPDNGCPNDGGGLDGSGAPTRLPPGLLADKKGSLGFGILNGAWGLEKMESLLGAPRDGALPKGMASADTFTCGAVEVGFVPFEDGGARIPGRTVSIFAVVPRTQNISTFRRGKMLTRRGSSGGSLISGES